MSTFPRPHFFSLAALIASATAVFAGEPIATLDQEFTQHDLFGGLASDAAQTFVVGRTGFLTQVDLLLRTDRIDNSSLVDPAAVFLYSAPNGQPMSNLAADSVPGSALPVLTDPLRYTSFVFETESPKVRAGDRLAVVLAAHPSGHVEWGVGRTQVVNEQEIGGYPFGAAMAATSGGWTGFSLEDFNFRTYVQPIPPPKVLTVAVGGLTWSGGSYSVPDGSARQLVPLPWTRINQLSLTFDKTVNLDSDSLSLAGQDGTMYPLFGPVTGNGPDPGTFKATWILEAPLGLGEYELRLSDSVLDDDGIRLDGEWVDGVSAMSGDGAGGGNFAFHFRVLPGDVNQDSAVTVLDWAEVRDRRGATRASPNWSVFHDIDRRGSVDQVDFDTVPRTAFTFLPPFPPAGPSDAAAIPEPSTVVLAFVAALALACYGMRRRV